MENIIKDISRTQSLIFFLNGLNGSLGFTSLLLMINEFALKFIHIVPILFLYLLKILSFLNQLINRIIVLSLYNF